MQSECRMTMVTADNLNRVAREIEQLSAKSEVHLAPRHFLHDFSSKPTKVSKKDGPVFTFQEIFFTNFLSSGLPNTVKWADSALCCQKCMFGGGGTLVLERSRWNHALFPTKQGWGCWLWWFLATSGHFCECRLSTGRLSRPHFSMGGTF